MAARGSRALAVLVATGAVLGWPDPAQATPPVIVFTEDFEHVTTDTEKVTAYVGATGAAYSADSYWLRGQDCNGYVIPSAVSPNVSGCTQNVALKAMAAALGVVAGTSQNHAVAAHTNADPQHNSRGRYFSNLGVLNALTSIGFVMCNGQGNANGNDHAFDNITVLDGTPSSSSRSSQPRSRSGRRRR